MSVENWSDYIAISTEYTPGQQAELGRSLDQLWGTPEGKQLIEQAYRLRIGSKPPISEQAEKLQVAPPAGEGINNRYDAVSHNVEVNVSNLSQEYYQDAEGNPHPYTLPRVLHQLMGYAADPYATLDCGAKIFSLDPNNGLKDALVAPAADATNAFMAKYFHESPRDDNNGFPLRGQTHEVTYKAALAPEPQNEQEHSSDGKREKILAAAQCVGLDGLTISSLETADVSAPELTPGSRSQGAQRNL